MSKVEDVDSQIRAVFFDLDETLIDSIQGHVGAHAEVCRMIAEFLNEKEISVDKRDLIVQVSRLDDEMNRQFRYDRDEWWPILFKKMMVRAELPQDLIKGLTRSYWLAYA